MVGESEGDEADVGMGWGILMGRYWGDIRGGC